MAYDENIALRQKRKEEGKNTWRSYPVGEEMFGVVLQKLFVIEIV